MFETWPILSELCHLLQENLLRLDQTAGIAFCNVRRHLTKTTYAPKRRNFHQAACNCTVDKCCNIFESFKTPSSARCACNGTPSPKTHWITLLTAVASVKKTLQNYKVSFLYFAHYRWLKTYTKHCPSWASQCLPVQSCNVSLSFRSFTMFELIRHFPGTPDTPCLIDLQLEDCI